MTELRAFNNPEFGTIRTIVEGGQTLFCGRDVANVLGYSDPKKAIARHCKGGTKRPLPTVSGLQETIFIPEADLYRLAFGSKLPTAEKFTDWVVEEVLPSIHHTGTYSLTAPRTPVLPEGVTFSSAVGFMRLARRVILDMGGTPTQVGMMMKETLETCGFPVPTSFRKQLEGQLSLFEPLALQ